MKIFHYSNDTGEYFGEGVADINPVDTDDYIIPAFSTTIEPPVKQDGFTAVFDGEQWSMVPDHRGQVWFNGREAVEIETLGDPTVEGLTPAISPLSVDEAEALTIARIKNYARGLIAKTGLPWMVEREVSGGKPIPKSIKTQVQAIRDASDRAEKIVKSMNDPVEIEQFDIAEHFK